MHVGRVSRTSSSHCLIPDLAKILEDLCQLLPTLSLLVEARPVFQLSRLPAAAGQSVSHGVIVEVSTGPPASTLNPRGLRSFAQQFDLAEVTLFPQKTGVLWSYFVFPKRVEGE